MVKRLLAAGLLGLPALAQACPRCFLSGPNHQGLIYATLFLLPIPLSLMALGLWWLRKEAAREKAEEPRGEA